jgi:hypothetical protein
LFGYFRDYTKTFATPYIVRNHAVSYWPFFGIAYQKKISADLFREPVLDKLSLAVFAN